MPAEKKEQKKEQTTGRYVYDKTLGKVVKISDDIPGLKKAGESGGDTCPMNPGAHKCNGCCGH